MATQREITDRIQGVEGIGQITRIMQAVSLAKAGRAQSAAEAARPYARHFRLMVARAAAAARRVRHPLLEGREVKRACLVVVTADQGLSGGFDLPMLRRAEQEARAFPAVSFVPVGRRGHAYLAFRGLDIVRSFTGLDENALFEEARAIAGFLAEGYGTGEFDTVLLIFSAFINFFEHRTVVRRLIPVPVSEKANEGAIQDERTYIFEPDAGAVLQAVLPLFVERTVFQALTESKASEHAARLAAMDGATRSAGDIVRRLTKQLHRARQAAITGELLDMVAARTVLQ